MLATIALLALCQVQRGDTTHVRADNPPLWGATPLTAAELRLGDLDGPPETAFGSVDWLAATDDGDFAIFDGGDTQIRRYNRKGQFLGLVGRKGAGPGEYKPIGGMAYLGDSVLAVWDAGNSRISFYAADGKFLRQLTITRPTFFGPKSLIADTAGRLWIRVPVSTQAPREGDIPTQYLAITITGEIADSIRIPPDSKGPEHFVLMSTDGARWSFPDETLFALSPLTGVAYAQSTRPGFILQRPGKTPLVVARTARLLPLEGPEREQWKAWGEYMATRGPNAAPSLPTWKPYCRDLFVDPAGRTWLEVYGPATTREPKPRGPNDKRPQLTLRDNTAFDVYADDGRFLGHITFPKETVVLTVTRTAVWVLEHGTEGQEQVVRYRLPAGR